MTVVDSALTRDVLRDIAKRPIDISELDVHAMHGVIYLRGRISNLRGDYESIDLHKELETIMKMLRVKMGVREVINEVEFGGPSIREQLDPHAKKTNYR